MFDQTTAILRPHFTGNFSIKVQLVGDYPTMRFKRWDPEATGDNIETWTRTASRTVDGRLVSLFEKVYPNAEFVRILRNQLWGFDDGSLRWGDVLLPDSDPKRYLDLRIASTNLPMA